jgi:hypothetical protein
MKLISLREAKIILKVNFATLFVLIVVTPFLVRDNLGKFPETLIEGFFLTIELIALIIVFKRYEAAIRKKEKEAYSLNSKLKSKERELLGAFEHLGKVNVEISMIKDLFKKMKVPSTKNQLKQMYAELLRIVCSVTGEKHAFLKIINLENGQSMGEYCEDSESEESSNRCEVNNRELLNRFETKKETLLGDYCVLYSAPSNFSIKAFLLINCGNKKKKLPNKEKRDFLKAIANQCEIIFLLFNSRYYKRDNSN